MIFDEYQIKSRLQRRRRPDGSEGCDTRALLGHARALRMAIDALAQNIMEREVSHLATIESRGFLFAAPLAYTLGKPLILINKHANRKDVIEESLPEKRGRLYLSGEEVPEGAQILLFDDAVCSGETMRAASTLLHRSGGRVEEAATLVTLAGAGGIQLMERLELNLYALVSLEAHQGNGA